MVLGKYLAQGQIKKKPPNPNVHQFRDVNDDLSTMILKFSFSNELSRWRLLGRPVFLMCLKNGTPHLHREWQQKTYLWARKLEKWPPLFWTSVLTITDLICAYFGEFCSHDLLLPPCFCQIGASTNVSCAACRDITVHQKNLILISTKKCDKSWLFYWRQIHRVMKIYLIVKFKCSLFSKQVDLLSSREVIYCKNKKKAA